MKKDKPVSENVKPEGVQGTGPRERLRQPPMPVWIVFVGDGHGHRFIDSIWADKDHCMERTADLGLSFKANSFGGEVRVLAAHVADAAVQSLEAPAGDADKGAQGGQL